MKTLNVALKYPSLMSISGPVTLASFDSSKCNDLKSCQATVLFFKKETLCRGKGNFSSLGAG